jgi:hypothetical protein
MAYWMKTASNASANIKNGEYMEKKKKKESKGQEEVIFWN